MLPSHKKFLGAKVTWDEDARLALPVRIVIFAWTNCDSPSPHDVERSNMRTKTWRAEASSPVFIPQVKPTEFACIGRNLGCLWSTACMPLPREYAWSFLSEVLIALACCPPKVALNNTVRYHALELPDGAIERVDPRNPSPNQRALLSIFWPLCLVDLWASSWFCACGRGGESLTRVHGRLSSTYADSVFYLPF